MKIKEILQLTQEMPVSEIAKQYLSIGEKKLRDSLKSIGAYPQRGKRGWLYDGDKAVLEQDIYEIAPPNKRGKVKAVNPESKEIRKEESKPSNNTGSKESLNTEKKKVTYEIEEWIHDKIRIQSILEKRNVSDIVNDLLKKGLM